MTPEDGLDSVETAMRAAGIGVVREQLLGRTTVVAQWTKFRWRWFATKLHLFLIACPFSAAEASKESLNCFLASAREFAISNKEGLPLGFQTGVAVIAVAVVDGLDQEAADWALHSPRARFAALAYPVSFDLRTGIATRPGRMVLGAIYLPYLRRFVDNVVAPALSRGR